MELFGAESIETIDIRLKSNPEIQRLKIIIGKFECVGYIWNGSMINLTFNIIPNIMPRKRAFFDRDFLKEIDLNLCSKTN